MSEGALGWIRFPGTVAIMAIDRKGDRKTSNPMRPESAVRLNARCQNRQGNPHFHQTYPGGP